jgi:hypothetical protein
VITQKFKGDPLELQMELAASPAFDQCSASLDDFFANGYGAAPFLLMLYDEGRMPFADRIPRDAFVSFFTEALSRFPFTGTFETYLFILQSLFGSGTTVLFTIPAPGKITIAINAADRIQFQFIATEFDGSQFVDTQMVDQDGSDLIFSGISGISSQYQLQQLLSELIPAGIFPSVSLTFFAIFDFIADDGSTMLDKDGNQIIFIQV